MPVEHMLTRGVALALDGAGALHTLSPEGTGSTCPLCQAASAGAAGAGPPQSLSPPQRVGSCPRRTRPTRGAEASARRPQKGRQRYKTGLLCNAKRLHKRSRPFCLFASEGGTRTARPTRRRTAAQGDTGATERERADARKSGGGRARSAHDVTASSQAAAARQAGGCTHPAQVAARTLRGPLLLPELRSTAEGAGARAARAAAGAAEGRPSGGRGRSGASAPPTGAERVRRTGETALRRRMNGAEEDRRTGGDRARCLSVGDHRVAEGASGGALLGGDYDTPLGGHWSLVKTYSFSVEISEN